MRQTKLTLWIYFNLIHYRTIPSSQIVTHFSRSIQYKHQIDIVLSSLEKLQANLHMEI